MIRQRRPSRTTSASSRSSPRRAQRSASRTSPRARGSFAIQRERSGLGDLRLGRGRLAELRVRPARSRRSCRRPGTREGLRCSNSRHVRRADRCTCGPRGPPRSPGAARAAPGSVAGVEYLNLGSTGLRVPRARLGTMSHGAPESLAGRSTMPPWSRSCGGRSRAGSRSSTPPTSTTADRARSSPDACSAKLFGMREEYVRRNEGLLRERCPARTAADFRRKHVLASIDASLATARPRLRRPLSDPSLGSARRRSRRRWKRCTTS